MKGFLIALAGSGVTIPIIAATVRHYWTKHLKERETR